MKPSEASAFALIPHAQSPSVAVRTLSASARLTPAGLALRYALAGDIARLRVPPPVPPRTADGLWRHLCFEAFVAGGDATYHEFNFSPSGEWAAYAFRAYRQRAAALPALDPRIVLRASDERLELQAKIASALLPAAPAPLRVALCAVIEDRDGAVSYWALRHAPGKPDFHHQDSFVLELV